LLQDISEAREQGTLQPVVPRFCEVDHMQKGDYTSPSHTVTVDAHSQVARLFSHEEEGPLTVFVNSMHHQCVARVAEGLVVTGRCPDGVIEAVEAPGKRFMVGVQWHPEFMLDPEYDPATLAQRDFLTVDELCGKKGTIDVLARAFVRACAGA
jgi:gamma-glutamyl-gamma-aminobutyrate hydrolase PuuD